MKYNRAIDYTVLALNELKNGKPVTAARLLAEAVKQSDINVAIATLEVNNKHAFSVQAAAKKTTASKRLKAADEFPFNENEVGDDETEVASEFEGDPLDDVEGEEPMEEEEAPAVAMAKVLSSMVAKRR